jgi:VWFA-related protein
VYATVRGPDGRLLTGLTQQDFQVFDNGRPVTLTVFSAEIQPITAAVMVDMSHALSHLLPQVREGLHRFVDSLLPHDRIRLGTFGSEISLSPFLTNDKAILGRVVNEELWPQGHSFPWPAVHAALESLAGEPGRRIVLLVNYNAVQDQFFQRQASRFAATYLGSWPGNYSTVRGLAKQHGALFYAIGADVSAELVPRPYEPRPDHPFVALSGQASSLANDSGGGYAVAKRGDFASTLVEVGDELRRQYVLGFVPVVRDGKEHKLEVRTSRGGVVRTRTSFIAPSSRQP